MNIPALIVQVIAILLCFMAIMILALKRTSSYSNVMVITCICGLVQNAGYLQELLATNVNESIFAIRSEYLGGAFEICLITLFVFKYCGHELSGGIKWALLIESIVILFSVWTCQWNPIYYTSVEFSTDGMMPHVVLGHGWLYYFFAITTICELIACAFIILVSLLKTNQKHMVYNYFILMLVAIMPLVGFVVSITGVLGAYDATPLSCALSIGLFAVSIANNHVFDVADVVGEKILADLDNAIIIINSEDGYEYSNNKAKELYPQLEKYKRGEVISQYEIKSIFDKKKDKLTRIGDKTFNVSVNTVTDGPKKEYVGKAAVFFDVTDSNKNLEEMHALIKSTKKAEKAKTEFLANISHEIRTPINTIMGMSEVLLRDYATTETREYISDIRNSGNTIANLVNDILDISMIESGKMEIIKDKFDMKNYLSEVLDVYKFRCTEKGLAFKHDINPDIPRYLVGDITRIKQIINNVLSNAVKFTSEGHVKLKLNYKHRSDFDLDLIFAIEDTGVGIKADEKKKLFDRFATGSQVKTRDADGSGLGLNITKQLLDIMGGVINFKSDENKGTVFSIVIPVNVSEDDIEVVGSFANDENKTEAFRASFTAPDAKILVVDDTMTNLIVIKGLLKDIKTTIMTVKSGEECLETMGKEHVDLVLLDHKMPGMDGIETFRKLREMDGQCKDVPVIMLTANATKESRELYIAEHFTDFLSKPVSSEELIQMLYKYLPENLININE